MGGVAGLTDLSLEDPRVNGSGIHTDFLKLAILIYEPQADGSLELVAVENLVFAGAWKEVGTTRPLVVVAPKPGGADGPVILDAVLGGGVSAPDDLAP